MQISWNAPCDEGSWLFEPGVGCRMWDWRPTSSDVVTWTGACRKGAMVGPGTLQWTEHERPIDRFEGAFVDGKRQGPGRYTWNESEWYVGFYENDLPHGLGTALIAGCIDADHARNARRKAVGASRRRHRSDEVDAAALPGLHQAGQERIGGTGEAEIDDVGMI